jgi:hypothetical protein
VSAERGGDAFQLGMPFPWPDFIPAGGSGQCYLYQEGNHLLFLFAPRLAPARIDAVQYGRLQMALFARGSLLLLCCHFDGYGEWFDIPYNWHLLPEQVRVIPPEVAPGAYLPFLVVLVDSQTMRIVGRRGSRFPPGFGRALHDALRAQSRSAFALEDFDRLIGRIHQEFPSPVDVLAVAQSAFVTNSRADRQALRN